MQFNLDISRKSCSINHIGSHIPLFFEHGIAVLRFEKHNGVKTEFFARLISFAC